MKERRKMIEVTRNIVIPDIVDQKCREAYDEIYRECKQKNENKSFFHKTENADGNVNEVVYRNCEHETKKRGSALKRAIPAAACAAAVLGGLIIPAASSYAPSIKSAFSNVSQEADAESMTDTGELNEKADLKYDNDVLPFEIEMCKTYSDGINVYAAFVLTPESGRLPDNLTSICGDLSLTINGKAPVPERDEDIICFSKAFDGKYYAELRHKGEDISQDIITYELKVANFRGENALIQNGEENPDGSIAYKPEEVKIDGAYEYSCRIVPDLSHNRRYELNDVQGDVILDAVEITPFMTKLYMEGISEDQSVRLSDQNGNNICYKDSDMEFETPFLDSKELCISVFSLIQDHFPDEYVFSVPLEEGIMFNYTIGVKYYELDKSDMVFDPPFEEVEAENKEKNNAEFDEMRSSVEALSADVDFNTSMNSSDIDEVDMNVNIVDYKVGSIYDYDLDIDPGVNGLEVYENETGSLDSAVLMLITLDIENTEDRSVSVCLPGIELISKEFSNKNIPEFYKNFKEYHYASNKEHYGKGSYFYDFAPHEKKTITFGYVVPDYCEEAGYWACFRVPGKPCGSDVFKDVLNGHAFLCEIK